MARSITLNEMREVVGKKIFGKDWFGGVSDKDWALITGPYGIKKRARASAGGFPAEIVPCPPSVASDLDRAIGRAARADAQYQTVDSWIEDRGLLSLTVPAERRIFEQHCRESFATPKALTTAKRGRKATLRPRVIADMREQLQQGATSFEQLRDMSDKDMEFRYRAGRQTCNEARKESAVVGKIN